MIHFRCNHKVSNAKCQVSGFSVVLLTCDNLIHDFQDRTNRVHRYYKFFAVVKGKPVAVVLGGPPPLHVVLGDVGGDDGGGGGGYCDAVVYDDCVTLVPAGGDFEVVGVLLAQRVRAKTCHIISSLCRVATY